VPGYHDRVAPLGLWTVRKIIVDSASLEALTGGERLGVVHPTGKRATVVVYPAAANTPIGCTNSLRRLSATQLEFDCGGYTNGTSGSALVVDPSAGTGLGTVVGVIGGYQEGGDTPSVSYAAVFGGSALSLYRLATNAA
jgi:hypothetical protein